jgi:hypothetical protein
MAEVCSLIDSTDNENAAFRKCLPEIVSKTVRF